MTEPAGRIAVALLAAGRGRRFGGDKRLVCGADGRSLLATTVSAFALPEVDLFVALREDDRSRTALMHELEALPARRVWVAEADKGMGHSLAALTAEIDSDPTYSHCFVALADMPFIRRETIDALLAARKPGRILVPVYRHQWGHPVCFPRPCFQDMKNLQGDRGARLVIERNRDACDLIEVEDPGILRDVDLPSHWPVCE